MYDKNKKTSELKNHIIKIFFMMGFLFFSPFNTSADIIEKEPYIETSDGRTLFIAKNNDGKVGMIDSNDRVIIPFKYFSGYGRVDNVNAYFVMFYNPSLNKGLELYDINGNKIIDSSKGYGLISESDLIPAYYVSKDDCQGLLNIAFEELLPPIYESISSCQVSNLRVVAVKKPDIHRLVPDNHECELWELTGLLSQNGHLIQTPLRGYMLPLSNLNKMDGDKISDSNEFYSAEFFTLYHLKGTPENEKGLIDSFYWNVIHTDDVDEEISGHFCIPAKTLVADKGSDKIRIYEANSPDEYIEFKGLKSPVLSFHVNQDIGEKSFKPNIVDILSEIFSLAVYKNPNKSNYSDQWVDDLTYMIQQLKLKVE